MTNFARNIADRRIIFRGSDLIRYRTGFCLCFSERFLEQSNGVSNPSVFRKPAGKEPPTLDRLFLRAITTQYWASTRDEQTGCICLGLHSSSFGSWFFSHMFDGTCITHYERLQLITGNFNIPPASDIQSKMYTKQSMQKITSTSRLSILL